jgi:predicted DNA-binding transcriptional regulator YafY
MAADYSRIHRLLKIITLIQGSKGWTSRTLAVECKTTERTIFRDMKMLEGAGIPYFYDADSRSYAIHRDFFMPPVQLTLDETLALAVLAERIGGQEQVPFTKAAGRAINKIKGQLPASVREGLDRIEDHVAIRLSAASAVEDSSDVYDQVRLALDRKQALQCTYEALGANRNDETFIFKPYTLFFNQRAWYVVGYYSTYDAIRCLKLSRFSSITLTSETYQIPKSFSLDRHLGNAWRMIRGKQSYDIELLFDAEFADTIADTHWHSTQDIIWNDDESITFRCKVDGLDEIVWWVLGMGPHCLVKQPLELAQRVKEMATRMVARYAGVDMDKPAKKKKVARRVMPTA